jgi:hypothetical protein
MDKFLIDPPDNITIDSVTVPHSEYVIPTGPPMVETPPVTQVETPSEPIISLPQYIQTGPPESVIKDSIDEPIRLTISPPTQPEEPVADDS